MEAWLKQATEATIILIDAIALVVVILGTIEAVIEGVKLLLNPKRTSEQKRSVWLNYARWLVAALTFQLAADIVETSIAPGWEDVARLGAIALIRTFLNFFLERDVEELRIRKQAAEGVPPREER